MAVNSGPDGIVQDGLVFCVDAANKDSYPGSGTTVIDLVGTNNSTISGATFTNVNAGVWDFDGIDDKITSVSNSGFTNNDPRTFSAWIKTTDSGNYRTIVQVGPDNNSNQNFELSTFGGFLHFSSWSTYNLTGNVTIADGSWRFVSLTFNGSVINGYVESSSAGPNLTNASINLSTTDTSYYIGGSATGHSSKWFNGNIGPILLYNKALSASEVKQNYNALKGRFI
jgi:hypothetical protein